MKQNSKIIGLTGGIATGKSTVSRYLIEQNYPVVDCDKLARIAVEPGRPAYIDIVDYFGAEILLEDGSLNRKALGNIVFSDKRKLDKLNEIIHPRIRDLVLEKIEEYRLNGYEKIFVDAPLLFETGLNQLCDEVWLVSIPTELQIERMVNRDNVSVDYAKSVIASQMSLEEKRKKSDKVIENSKDLASLYKLVDELLK
jgi:dephospho-CoA kinase